jgi:hypothetical protein
LRKETAPRVQMSEMKTGRQISMKVGVGGGRQVMTPTHYCAGALPDTVCVQGHHLTLLHCISLIMLFSPAINIRDGMHRLYSLFMTV